MSKTKKVSIFVFFFLITLNLPPLTAKDWQIAAQQDLEYIRMKIEEIHPAFIQNDKDFNYWLEVGYEKSLNSISKINSRSDASALLKYYVNGFKDIHMTITSYEYCFLCFNFQSAVFRGFVYSPQNRIWAGFTLMETHSGQLLVNHSSKDWSARLPEKGDILKSCDGINLPSSLDDYKIGVFSRRNISELEQIQYEYAFTLRGSNGALSYLPLWESCQFYNSTLDTITSYPIQWQALTIDDIKDIGIKNNIVNFNYTEQENKINHLSLPTFSYSEKIKHNIEKTLLPQLQKIQDDSTLFIDLRRNSGGSLHSVIKLFASLYPAAVKQSKHLKNISNSSYRASAALINHFESIRQTYGKSIDDLRNIEIDNLLGDLRQARGNTEMVERSTNIVENTLSKFNNFRKKDFQGNVIILTDKHCNSACLTFLDLMKDQPNVLHVGEVTNSDTVYGESIKITTPNFIKVFIPTKHNINRIRKSNSAIKPDIVFDGDISNSKVVYQWISSEIIPQVSKN